MDGWGDVCVCESVCFFGGLGLGLVGLVRFGDGDLEIWRFAV